MGGLLFLCFLNKVKEFLKWRYLCTGVWEDAVSPLTGNSGESAAAQTPASKLAPSTQSPRGLGQVSDTGVVEVNAGVQLAVLGGGPGHGC